jgi:cytochrome c biogenesis protein CcmG/thiol:disulfide interchange protein DsbE
VDRRRRSALLLGCGATALAVVAAIAAGAAVEALGGDDGPTPEAELHFRAEDADGQGLVMADPSGEAVPADQFSTLDGRLASFGDYAGAPLVVNFFAEWCQPCRNEMPAFEEVHQELGDQVAFLGINPNEPVDAARRIVEDTGVTYDIGRDPNGALMEAFQVTGLPATFVIAPDGTIASSHPGELDADDLRAALAPLLR